MWTSLTPPPTPVPCPLLYRRTTGCLCSTRDWLVLRSWTSQPGQPPVREWGCTCTAPTLTGSSSFRFNVMFLSCCCCCCFLSCWLLVVSRCRFLQLQERRCDADVSEPESKDGQDLRADAGLLQHSGRLCPAVWPSWGGGTLLQVPPSAEPFSAKRITWNVTLSWLVS